MGIKIILDTNFLLIPGQFKVDIFSEIERICDFKYELTTVPEVLRELCQIATSSREKDKKAAKMALQLLRNYKIRELNYRKVFKTADEAIVTITDRNTIVATQDRLLRRRLQRRGARLIILRQKQYLKFLGE